ncbi:hypothetical protein DIS18_09865 [Algibacter marinivivus]|uniref:Carrier domain-containing protein n=1 Tax=Algibacter marinivivus TaxID=2100723 RepID=A0A2U2X430_9FLAO|nr:non-ribosomal peptide synthetase [Algibacter marinivivus]PWH82543.1 hypothetical protein DIS18_09865 [Algibacter marinivivus]
MEKKLNKESLLDKWKNKQKKENALAVIQKAPSDAIIPLSHGQKRFWFLQQMYPQNPFYNLSEIYEFQGDLNVDVLEKSLKLVFENHKIFKSFYTAENGSPKLNISDSVSLELEKKEFSKTSKIDVQSFLDEQAHINFDLDSAPLIKASLLKLNKSKYILFLTMHHIIADQWSMRVLRETLAKNYKSLLNDEFVEETKTEINFFDYAYWEENSQNYDKEIKYWKTKLSGKIPNLNLPNDFNRPAKPSYKGDFNSIEFSKETSLQVLETSKKLGITPFVLFLSAYYILLRNFSQQEDILIGSPVSNRNQKNLEDVFGLFIDTIVLRTSVNKSLTIFDFINEVKKMFSEALSNKDIPFDNLVKELNLERSLSTNPLFQVMFVYSTKSELPDFGDDLTLTKNSEYNAKVSKFDLTLFITDNDGKLTSTFEYATDLFEEKTIIRFQDYLKYTLNFIINDVNNRINSIPVFTENDAKLFSLNDSQNLNSFSNYKSIHSIIEDVSKKHPSNTALTFKNESITYKVLNEEANNVARKILENPPDGEIIALCLERSLDMIISMLGILKSGYAYLPIDPEYPQKRIDFILKDAGVDSILTHTLLSKHLNNCDAKQVLIDTINKKSIAFPKELPNVEETNLAYVIYTSGSSGKPKGVPITHKNIINSTASRLDFYDNNPTSFLLMSSISFDSSKAGIFWTLCTGGNLVITEKRIEQDIDEISNVIEQQKVSHTLMLPSLYQVILNNVNLSKLRSLNTVVVAGEACSKSLCKTHFKTLPNASLYNEYGPTEASVWCIAHKIKREDVNRTQIPIGKPIANSRIHLLSTEKNNVPIGVSGEIYIGGANLSKGYINRPELTESAFIKNPFSKNEKLYKTGDLAKYNNDGSIQFLGRADQQIKIRGFRVELDDIENTIDKNEQVEKCIILVKKYNKGNLKRLVAYIKPANTFNEEVLKSALKKELPDYMIPSSFILIDEMPLLPNGKIDRSLLNKTIPESTVLDSENIEKPKNEIEEKLLKIWEETLNISPISTNDNFFEIGGDSIMSIQIISKARKNGVMLSPNQLFEHQTISGLSKLLIDAKKQKDEWSFMAKIRSEGNKKPLFCIHSGGGHVFFYGLLKKYLKADRPIYAVQPVGLYGSEDMHKSIEEMTSEYLKAIRKIQPKGPYNILVYCFSTSVGNEMAIQLDKIGEEINIIVADTMASPWNATDSDSLKTRVFSFLKRFLMNPFKAINTFLKDRVYLLKAIKGKYFGKSKEKQLEELKANLRKISVDYTWKKNKGNVSLLLTEKPDENFNKFIVKSWKKYAKGGITIYPTKGNHPTLFEEPDVQFVSEQIDKCIID